MLKFIRKLFGLIAALGSAFPGAATNESMDMVAGSWNDLASFVTMGGCASSPLRFGLVYCHPARIAVQKEQELELSAFVAASELILQIGDDLRKNTVQADSLNKLLGEYNYAELLAVPRVAWLGPNLTVGVEPYRIFGQFQLHNPFLPLASISLREDKIAYVGTGLYLTNGFVRFALGARVNYLDRKSTTIEATLVDIGSKHKSEYILQEKSSGMFVDTGAIIEFANIASAEFELQDMGGYASNPKDPREDAYLFVYDTRNPRVSFGASILPHTTVGDLQLGARAYRFFNEENAQEDQWFATASYFLGPLKLYSGFRDSFLRTGISMSYKNIRVSSGQEWVNQLQSDGKTQPRLIIELSAYL